MNARRFEFHLTPLARPGKAKPVFHDPERRRRKWIRRFLALITFTFVFWIAAFFSNVQPNLSVNHQSGSRFLGAQINEASLPAASSLPDREWIDASQPDTTCADIRPRPFTAMASEQQKLRVFAHLPVSMEWSHLSLSRSCAAINVIIPDWLVLNEREADIIVETPTRDTMLPVTEHTMFKSGQVELMPRIQINRLKSNSSLDTLLDSEEELSALVNAIVQKIGTIGAVGACLDYAQLVDSSDEVILSLSSAFLDALSSNKLRSCIIVDSEFEFLSTNKVFLEFEHVIVKAFYQPWVGSTPRPHSENDWLSQKIERAQNAIPDGKLVIALGNFATQWTSGEPLPVRLPYAEAVARIYDAGGELVFSPSVSGSYSAFRSSNGRRETIWMQEAAALHNQLSLLEKLGVKDLAIWSLGEEDPGIWPLLSGQSRLDALTEPSVTTVKLSDYVRYSGSGAALSIKSRPSLGVRHFELDPNTGYVTNVIYEYLPKPYEIERYAETKRNELILTFDDGPHPTFTPKILDILQETGTPATFFVLGQSVMSAPEILQRINEDGHEIGAHTFSHPRMDLVSDSRTLLEHDLTQRVIAGAIGHTTKLYREPFLRSGGPINAKRVPPLETVQADGAIIFGMDVVPKDWKGLTGDEIASYVINQVEAGNGRVILLHDGGNDRSASVEALPIIIEELQRRGYVFTTTANALGLSRSDLMPVSTSAWQVFDKVSFSIASGTFGGLAAAVWVVLIIGLGRAALLVSMVAVRKPHKALKVSQPARVAVIIPAFDEEGAIANCIQSVLSSRYENYEVIVVNDGSVDNTLNEVLRFKHKPNVRVILQPNQGKWAALNRALLSTDAAIVVCIDADTQIHPLAIRRLADHFSDPKVGAVAGKIVVGNRNNLLTRLQALEYVSAQNFDRLAFDAVNGILVVPGALGAWRVDALHKAGLFSDDTLAEDSDVTISVNRAGYRVAYDEHAIGYTEAPETVRGLLSQRLRWSLGMFQSAWKHRKAAIERRNVGLLALPDMMLFGYVFPLLAPIADFFVLVYIIDFFSSDWAGEVGNAPNLISNNMLFALIVLPVIELLIVVFSVFRDGHASKSLVMFWPLYRVFYRPLLYFTVFRTIVYALYGTLAKWGGAKRQGHIFLEAS